MKGSSKYFGDRSIRDGHFTRSTVYDRFAGLFIRVSIQEDSCSHSLPFNPCDAVLSSDTLDVFVAA